MPPTTRLVIAAAIRDLGASGRVLALTDLAYKLLAFALLTPGTALLLRWAMARTGAAVVADTDIAMFFLTTRQGIGALILGGAIVLAITALELACLMAIGISAAGGRYLSVKGALAFGAVRAWPVLRLTANVVARCLAGLVPFAAAIAAVYWALLREHDINFYLATRPPAFWGAVALAALIVVAGAIVLARTVARWALALPLVLFEAVAPRRALKESATRSNRIRALTIVSLTVWATFAVTLAALVVWVPEIIGRGLAPRFSDSLGMLLVFITGLVLAWVGLGLAAGVINASLFALVLARLYLYAGTGPAFQAPASGGFRDAAPKLPVAVRLGALCVGILAAIGFTLIVAGIARRDQPVSVIAHRGASFAAPENTLAAFRLAADERADFVELDVQESADGEVVVVHDSDLMKVGQSPLRIWEATAAELRAVDIGTHKDARFSVERVPTLAEALAACKGRVRMIVELKSYGHADRLEERVAALVEAAGMERDTVFMSLDHAMVKRMKQLRPGWTVGALVAKAIGDLTSLGADFLAVEAGLATRAFVRQAHQANQAVYVWTVNDPAWMLRAMSHGVDGLITDKPDLARRVIERRSAMSDPQRILVALLVVMGARAEALVAEEALQPYTLAGLAVLPARATRAGSPPSGAFFTASHRATTATNGIDGPADGPYLPEQPLQGISSMVPADGTTWWALADNGYGQRESSGDFQLVFHRIDLRWGNPAGPRVLESTVIRDPDRRLPWTIVCDPTTGSALSRVPFNRLPGAPVAACGQDPAARILTGFDLDPESFVRAADGSFWVGDEFGPFLIHVAADGRVLAPPVEIPGVRSPQNPFLNAAERPTLAASRGFEGVAISPDGSTLHALLEGAVLGDDARDLRLYSYDIAKAVVAPVFLKIRLEALEVAGEATEENSIGEIKAVNDHQFLLIERDSHGDGPTPPAMKKLFLVDIAQAASHSGYASKKQLVDLLAIPDPAGLGGEMNFFRFPFTTIESVHVVDGRTLLVASDNNFPFSNGRARSRSRDRTGPLSADNTEFVLIRLASPLEVDRRLLPGGR